MHISCTTIKQSRHDQGFTSLLSVIVKDQGPGIAESDQGRLFKPFAQIKHRVSGFHEPKSGAGIGLYASKVICEKLGGDICCFSEGEDMGTVFEFRV